MKKFFFIVLLTSFLVSAKNEEATFDDIMRSADQWARENLDEDALRVLQNVDREKVRQLFNQIQKQLQADYVVDLAALRDTARTVIPLLERYEETLPYALWLKARLDSLDVAEGFRKRNPLPRAAPGQPPAVAPNPPAQIEREIWIKQLADRPWPKTAKVFVPRLKPIFSAQKVPAELVWVAEVESSFDPRARSPAGAAGLFQIMPETAKRYGLRVRPFDQPLKPDESARA